MSTILQQQNEIVELIYIEKVSYKMKGKIEYMRQFLIRKNYQLDLMYTNGLNYFK